MRDNFSHRGREAERSAEVSGSGGADEFQVLHVKRLIQSPALPGFGEMKTRIMVSILAKRFGVQPPGWEKHAATWHSVADVDSAETMAQARAVKREMKAAKARK